MSNVTDFKAVGKAVQTDGAPSGATPSTPTDDAEAEAIANAVETFVDELVPAGPMGDAARESAQSLGKHLGGVHDDGVVTRDERRVASERTVALLGQLREFAESVEHDELRAFMLSVLTAREGSVQEMVVHELIGAFEKHLPLDKDDDFRPL